MATNRHPAAYAGWIQGLHRRSDQCLAGKFAFLDFTVASLSLKRWEYRVRDGVSADSYEAVLY